MEVSSFIHVEGERDEILDDLKLSYPRVEKFLGEVASRTVTELDLHNRGETLLGLFGLFVDGFEQPHNVGAQTKKLLEDLRHDRPSDAARKFKVTPSAVRNMETNAIDVMVRQYNLVTNSLVDEQYRSALSVETFREAVDTRDFFGGQLDDDEVDGVIELYGRTKIGNTEPVLLERRLEGLRYRLQGKRPEEIAVLLNANKDVKIGNKKITRQTIDNDYHAIKTTLRQVLGVPEAVLDPLKVEAMRQQIKDYTGKELLLDPLDDDEVRGLFDIFGRTLDAPDQKFERFMEYISGKSMKDIASETGVDPSAQSRAKTEIVRVIALEVYRLFETQTLGAEINTNLDTLTESQMLSKLEADILRYHFGTSQDIPEQPTPQMITDVSTRVYRLLQYKNGNIGGKGSPTDSQMRVNGRILGDRAHGHPPISTDELVARLNHSLDERYDLRIINKSSLEKEKVDNEILVLKAVSRAMRYLALSENEQK